MRKYKPYVWTQKRVDEECALMDAEDMVREGRYLERKLIDDNQTEAENNEVLSYIEWLMDQPKHTREEIINRIFEKIIK